MTERYQPSYIRLGFALLLSAYFVWVAATPMQGSFLDLVDLPIHETGHLLFRPLGEFMMVAGGSLFQVIMPAAFVGYFFWHGKYYSASIILLWVGQSILNIYVYAADAVNMQLVLTSGLTGSEGSFHDWNYMLDRLGLLGETKVIAGTIRAIGTLTIVAGIMFSIYYSFSTTAEDDLDTI